MSSMVQGPNPEDSTRLNIVTPSHNSTDSRTPSRVPRKLEIRKRSIGAVLRGAKPETGLARRAPRAVAVVCAAAPPIYGTADVVGAPLVEWDVREKVVAAAAVGAEGQGVVLE